MSELKNKTVKELRGIASNIPEVEGEWEMKKENLIEAIEKHQVAEKTAKKPKQAKKPESKLAALEAENERLRNRLEIGADKTHEQVMVENQQRPEQKTKPMEAGFKTPSIANQLFAHTKEGYKKLIEAYKKQNPVKYEQKKSELEAKLKEKK